MCSHNIGERGSVPDFDGAIRGGCEQHVPIRVHGQGADNATVRLEGLHHCLLYQVPIAHAACGQQAGPVMLTREYGCTKSSTPAAIYSEPDAQCYQRHLEMSVIQERRSKCDTTVQRAVVTQMNQCTPSSEPLRTWASDGVSAQSILAASCLCPGPQQAHIPLQDTVWKMDMYACTSLHHPQGKNS